MLNALNSDPYTLSQIAAAPTSLIANNYGQTGFQTNIVNGVTTHVITVSTLTLDNVLPNRNNALTNLARASEVANAVNSANNLYAALQGNNNPATAVAVLQTMSYANQITADLSAPELATVNTLLAQAQAAAAAGSGATNSGGVLPHFGHDLRQPDHCESTCDV